MTREKAIKLLANATYSEEWQGNEDLQTAHNMAIEALKQEPCEDCVSRKQALIGIRNLYPGIPFTRQNVKKWKEENKKYFECENVIRDLPLVTQKTNWIPASERLPKQNEYVGDVCKYYLVQNEFGDMLVATYTNNGWIPINTMQALEYDVVAWCSLPEPYQEE